MQSFLYYINPYNWFRRFLSYAIMQVQLLAFIPAITGDYEDALSDYAQEMKKEGIVLRHTKLPLGQDSYLGNNIILQGIEFYPDSFDENQTDLNKGPLIIYCFGNGGIAGMYRKEMCQTSKRLGVHCVGYNHRNSVGSEGLLLNAQDLVNDMKNIVKYYVEEKGYDPEKIVLKGHSMGGGITTVAAAQLHQENYKVAVYNDRSYKRLSDALLWIIAERPSHTFLFTFLTCITMGFVASLIAPYFSLGALFTAGNVLKVGITVASIAAVTARLSADIIAITCRPLFTVLTYLSGWELDAESAFLSLPESKRSFCVVRSPKKKKFNEHGTALLVDNGSKRPNAPFDGTISPRASLHEGLRRVRTEQRRALREQLKTETDPETRLAIQRRLDDLKNCKMTCLTTHASGFNGHTTPFYKLKSRHSAQSADNHFERFVRTTTSYAGPTPA